MKIVKSSEIASYIFCPVCWWNKRTKGLKITESIKKGVEHHAFISKNQSKAKFFHVFRIIVLFILVVLIIWRFLI